MLILFETPAGYALFKANEKKLQKVDNIFDEFFSTPEKAQDLCVARGAGREGGTGRGEARGARRVARRAWASLVTRARRVSFRAGDASRTTCAPGRANELPRLRATLRSRK